MKTIIKIFVFFVLITACNQSATQKNKIQHNSKLVLDNSSTDTLLLADLTNQIRSGKFPNFHSIVVINKGEIIYEQYFKGNDELHGKEIGLIEHTSTTLHDVRSISKSVVSTCIGIAIDNNLITNVKQKISNFFPEYQELFIDEKANWTIEHFLTMSTGMLWNEDVPYGNVKNDETRMRFSNNPLEYVLTRPMDTVPGKKFNYNGGATQVLLDIIERTSKLSMEEFVNKYLFSQIEINSFEWTKWNKSNRIAAPSGLRLTTRGLVNYALLYRNQGKWNNRQIINSNWIKQSFDKHISYPSELLEGDEYYGYKFWIWDDIIGSRKTEFVAASGNGDQNIYWDLNSDLIVVTTAGNYNIPKLENLSYEILTEYIYKAVFNDE